MSRHILPTLVTGGAGFLGARLVRRLVATGAPVHLLVRPTSNLRRIAGLTGVHLHTCDLIDSVAVGAVVDRVRPRTVFHVAATGAYTDDWSTLFGDNVLATFNLLCATAALPECRFIHTASSLEPGPRKVPIRESDPFAPRVPYGATKAASTLLMRQAAAAGRAVVMLRPFAMYGPGEPEKRLIPTAIRAALHGTPLRLTAPGYTRDLVFVDDVVDAYVTAAAAEGIEGELFNVGTGRATANEEVVQAIASIVGRTITVEAGSYPPRPTDTALWCADVTKARERLGWSPTHTLEQGLAETVAAARESIDVV